MHATTYLADLALLDDTITPRVAIEIDASGTITALHPGATKGERLFGLVVPGMANLHSHAFQRGMAGLAERGGPQGDDFWAWREVMYRFLRTLTPEDVEAIAAQLYAECLRHGYTAIAEFHYLHNAPDGAAYGDPAELSHRIVAAAHRSGIGLTLLPVLYRRGSFGGAPPTEGQRRFVMGMEAFARLCETMAGTARLGIAPHSLRAVTPDELGEAVRLADVLGADTPIHIHAAEQVKEVEQCLAWSGQRPVAWLLDHAPIGPRWCLIHATHLDEAECRGLAGSGAVAGLCPSTEGNLGDGLFPFRTYQSLAGRFGVGGDSHVSVSPAEELRWLDYGQRLRSLRRSSGTGSVGAALLRGAWAGGAQALGRNCGAIAPGRRADLVVLDTDHPALAGRSGEALLDSWVFCGNDTPVRDVMVDGRWVVRDGAHIHGTEIAAAFRAAMRRLADAL